MRIKEKPLIKVLNMHKIGPQKLRQKADKMGVSIVHYHDKHAVKNQIE